ncbi:MAG: flagellar basal body L-ring protein FlgH [Deltaproteobacteria bacterium]|nr:flagellar basal body L-ring protein FlgH [Deltaproteobacteria bacterium]
MKTRFVSIFSSAPVALLAAATLLAGCATAPKLPPPPSKYVQHQDRSGEGRTANSLWSEGGGLLEDFRARRINDLLTINVLESISGSGAADTAAAKNSTLDASVTGFFGAPLNLNKSNLYGQGYTFSPSVSGSMTNDFQGTGTTNRTGSIVGTITARVVEVMPNGTLSVESRKDITINNEKQTLVLRGSVRPEDISVANTIPSTKVADADIYLVGDGVLQDKQRPGWLVRILDGVWPF